MACCQHCEATEAQFGAGTAELVTLDRVLCCYPDWSALVRRSAARASRLYAFSVPREAGPIRAVLAVQNFLRRLRGNAFRTFVHPIADVGEMLAGMGFRPRETRRTLTWHVAVYERRSA